MLESGDGWLVMGIGMNVRHHPEGGLYPSTSLVKAGAGELGVDDVLTALLEALAYWYKTLETKGFDAVRLAWLEHAKTGPMTLRLPDNTIEGEFAGLNATGHLLLRLADGSERAIATGDVFPVFRTKDASGD